MLSLNASGHGEELKKEKAATMIKKIMKLFTKDPRDNFLIISDYGSLCLVHTVEKKINFISTRKVTICFTGILGEASDRN